MICDFQLSYDITPYVRRYDGIQSLFSTFLSCSELIPYTNQSAEVTRIAYAKYGIFSRGPAN